MNTTLPIASVTLAWHEYYTKSGRDVTVFKKKPSRRKSVMFGFGGKSSTKDLVMSPPKTKPVKPPMSPSKNEEKTRLPGLAIDDALEAALQAAHQKLETSKNSFTSSSAVMTNNNSETFEDVVEMIEASNSNKQKKTKLQLLQDGRSLWLVWNRGVRVPDEVSKVLYACDSERAVLSWNAERCKVKRPSMTEVLDPEDMKRSLILSCVVKNKQGGDTDAGSNGNSDKSIMTQRAST